MMRGQTIRGQTIRRGCKCDQVLAGAREVFLRDGLDGASVDDVARAAGVSEAMLHGHVPDRRLLFMEVAKAECRHAADEAEALIGEDVPVAEALHLAGQRIVAFAQSDFGHRMFRMRVAESGRFPALGAAFYESGPGPVRARLSRLLEKAVARGEVRIDDPGLAADQRAQLCKADLHDRAIFGIATTAAPRDMARVVEGAVAMFMARYGV